MKTRIIQSEPEPEGSRTSGNGAVTPPPTPAHNLAARMARWSGQHRKKAVFGWLAFAVLAFAIGTAIGSKQISDLDQFTGEAHDAEVALDRAGLRPVSEVGVVNAILDLPGYGCLAPPPRGPRPPSSLSPSTVDSVPGRWSLIAPTTRTPDFDATSIASITF